MFQGFTVPGVARHNVATAVSVADAIVSNITADNRLSKRAAIKSRLAQVEAAERQSASIREAISKFEAELTAAVEAHQRQTAPIQELLKDESLAAENRIELRMQLTEINHELQRRADELNAKIAAGNDELAALFTVTCQKPSLQRGLFATGDPNKLRELAVAKSSCDWARNRLTAGKKRLSEIEAELAHAKRGRRGEWTRWGQRDAEAKLSPEAAAAFEDAIALQTLEVAAAQKWLTAASAEVAKLETAIKAE